MARRTTASVVLVVLKAAGLTAVNLILWAAVTTAGARLFGVEPLLDLAAPSADSLACALAASAAHAAVLSWLAVRSGWRGVKLLAALGGVYFGMNAVLPRLAGLCWDSDVTGALTRALLDSGAAAVSSGAFAVLAAALFRKLAGSLESGVVKGRLVMPFWELLGKVTFLAGVVFPLLYFAFRYHLSFGYEDGVFVAGRAGDDLARAARTWSELSGRPGLYAWQAARALVWLALAAPVIRMCVCGWVETGLLAGALFAALPSFQHMGVEPSLAGQMAAFASAAPMSLAMGLAAAWLLNRRHRSLADLFSRRGREKRKRD